MRDGRWLLWFPPPSCRAETSAEELVRVEDCGRAGGADIAIAGN